MNAAIHFILYSGALLSLLFLHEFANWQSVDQGRAQRNRYQSVLLVVVILMLSDWMVVPLLQIELTQQLIAHNSEQWGAVAPVIDANRWVLFYLPTVLIVLLSVQRFKRVWLRVARSGGFAATLLLLLLMQSFYYLGLVVEGLQISGWLSHTLLQRGGGLPDWFGSKEQLTAQFVLLVAVLVTLYSLYRRRTALLQR